MSPGSVAWGYFRVDPKHRFQAMLDRLKTFFTEQAPSVDDEASLHLAAAVLLIEVAKADHALEEPEIARIKAALARDWGLGEQDLANLGLFQRRDGLTPGKCEGDQQQCGQCQRVAARRWRSSPRSR